MKTLLLLISCVSIAQLGMAQNIPVDFEDGGFGADWAWRVFENDTDPALEIVENPDMTGVNLSETVAKFTALQTGMPFAGCETMHGADIGTFTVDSSNMIIRIMVWKSVISDVGIKLVRVDNWSLGELKVPNTLTNEWEQLTFDFSEQLGLEYDQLVIFPDFNARAEDQIIYFDNVFGEEYTPPSGIAEMQNLQFNLYPNPASDLITLQATEQIESVEIFNSVGQMVYAENGTNLNRTLDISSLQAGVYIVRIKNKDGVGSRVITKE